MPRPWPGDSLFLSGFQAALVNDNEHNLLWDTRSCRLESTEMIVNFQFKGIKDTGAVKSGRQNPCYGANDCSDKSSFFSTGWV